MSDCEESEDSCGEEQVVPKWEVRREWLEDIFIDYFKTKELQQGRIYEFKIHPGCTICSTNESVLSNITYVKTKFYETFRYGLNIVIKRLPDDPFSRFFVTEGQYDLREIKFYTQIIPDLEKFKKKYTDHDKLKENDKLMFFVPTCFYAHYSPAGGTDDSPVPPESILVLEDDHFCCIGVKFSEGLTYHQAKVALDSIAYIHAVSLCMKIKEEQPLPERYPFLFQNAKATDSYQQLVERGFTQLAHFLTSVSGMGEILDALMALRPKTKDIIMTLLAPEGPLAAITHMDFWCNNLLFRYVSEHGSRILCYILNWQMVAYSKPTNDIALLLVSSLPGALRRKHTDSLLDSYWKTLNYACNVLGVDIPQDLGYTREDLTKDYRRSQLLALLLCIGSIDIALGHHQTKQRLIDVLQDLYQDGILTEEVPITTEAADA